MPVPAQDRSTPAAPATALLLATRPRYRRYLEQIVAYERSHVGSWTWSDVAVDPRTLTVLVVAGVIRPAGRELGGRLYELVDRDETRGALEASERAR